MVLDKAAQKEKKRKKKRLTIAIVSPGTFSVPPVVGSSVEHDIEMVVKELKKKHHVVVYTRKCKEYPASSRAGKLEYRRFAYDHWHSYVRKVTRDLKKLDPDIIQIENRPRYVGKIKKHFPHTPIILNMHSMQFASEPHISSKKVNQAMHKIDALITNSHFLKKEYVRRFPFLKKKAYPVHLGIETTPYEQAQRDHRQVKKLRKKYGINTGDPVLLFAGRLKKEKGVHHLIQALPAVIKKYPRVKLLIVGSPKYGNNAPTAYAKKIQRQTKGLDKQVVFTHFVKPRLMPYIYQLADVVVTPSVWGEPFCRVNLEAMAAGIPIVTTKRGGIPEVVQNGKHGYVLALKDISSTLPQTLSKLLRSKKKRKKFGAAGLQEARKFTWKKTAHQYVSIYQRLL